VVGPCSIQVAVRGGGRIVAKVYRHSDTSR
jgi:hypothetical protein